jgi:hypothetical protein
MAGISKCNSKIMKQFYIIYILTFLTACSSTDNKNKITNNLSDSSTQTINLSISDQPARTIIDFLEWYRDNANKIETDLVNNASNETSDSTKFYSVNFEATERYLTTLLKTDFISDKYADKWRAYFKKCDKDFKESPSNEGPPEGFDYDLVMLSQETEENLKHLEKTQIIDSKIEEKTAVVNLHFINGDNLQYKLTKTNDNWLIDDIERR